MPNLLNPFESARGLSRASESGMSSMCGVPIPLMQPTTSELGGISTSLSLSHKRIGTGSQVSLYIPEAKRQQLGPSIARLNGDALLAGKCDFEDQNIASTKSYIDGLLDIVKSADEPEHEWGLDSGCSKEISPLFHASPPLQGEAASDLGSAFPGHNVDIFGAFEFIQHDSAKLMAVEEDKGEHGPEIPPSADAACDDDTSDGGALLKCLPTSIDELISGLGLPHGEDAVFTWQEPAIIIGALDGDDDICSLELPVLNDLDTPPFDEDDLEVAMINESFEEQQKQTASLAYECKMLGSILLTEASNTPWCIAAASAATIIHDPQSGTIEAAVSPDKEQCFCVHGVAEEDEEQEDLHSSGDGCPGSPNSNEFIPVLTPKSKQFVKRQPPPHLASGPNGLLTPDNQAIYAACHSSSNLVQPTTTERTNFPLIYAFSRPAQDERHSGWQQAGDVMVLLESCPADSYIPWGVSSTAAAQFPPASDTSQNTSGVEGATDDVEEEVSSTTILDECADAAEATAYGVIASLFSSPVNSAHDTRTLCEAPTPFGLLCSVDDVCEELPEAKLLSQSLLLHLSTLYTGLEGCPRPMPRNDASASTASTGEADYSEKKPQSLYAEGGPNSSSTNSSSSAICAMAGAKEEEEERDEQQVPSLE